VLLEVNRDASAAEIENVSADSQQSSNNRTASEKAWDKARLEPKEDRAQDQDDQWLMKSTGCLEDRYKHQTSSSGKGDRIRDIELSQAAVAA
jgi:hypothetical protein